MGGCYINTATCFDVIGSVLADLFMLWPRPKSYVSERACEKGREGEREEGRKGGREGGRKGGREEGRGIMVCKTILASYNNNVHTPPLNFLTFLMYTHISYQPPITCAVTYSGAGLVG